MSNEVLTKPDGLLADKFSLVFRSIEKPAKSVGLKFEEGVVNKLIQDVLGEDSALPLLQFTLLKLWGERERNRISMKAYIKLQGAFMKTSKLANVYF